LERAGVYAPVRFGSISKYSVTRNAAAGEFMKSIAERLFRDEDGQDLIEYALLCALLALACITGILQLTQIREFFARVGAALGAAG
jgi:Flp pilus assembly pilin Flp